MEKIGVLLVNLGTPDSPSVPDVKKYLIEFLTDGRVIDIPWFSRQLLVRGVIVPKRAKESAANYAKVWTKEGSPLLVHGRRVKELLQDKLGQRFQVELAMRYQNPSIPSGLENLKTCSKIIVLPLFPQYASATTGSIFEKIMETIKEWTVIPKMEWIQSYPTQNKMIETFVDRGANLQYDHVVMSFHGLPERHVRKADLNGYCLKSGCCTALCAKNFNCYSAQCHATAQAIAKGLNLSTEQYTVCFQSRLGKDPWLKPYTQDVVKNLAKQGVKRLLVYSPAFVADCLETLDEIGRELKGEFLAHGGESLELVEGLNDHPLWIECLEDLIIPKELQNLVFDQRQSSRGASIAS